MISIFRSCIPYHSSKITHMTVTKIILEHFPRRKVREGLGLLLKETTVHCWYYRRWVHAVVSVVKVRHYVCLLYIQMATHTSSLIVFCGASTMSHHCTYAFASEREQSLFASSQEVTCQENVNAIACLVRTVLVTSCPNMLNYIILMKVKNGVFKSKMPLVCYYCYAIK